MNERPITAPATRRTRPDAWQFRSSSYYDRTQARRIRADTWHWLPRLATGEAACGAFPDGPVRDAMPQTDPAWDICGPCRREYEYEAAQTPA